MTSWSCTAGTSRSPTRDLVKGLAPLAAKTDRIDAWVLAELSRRELVPAIWLPDPGVRAERERARWRLHLVRHRTGADQPHPRHPDGLRLDEDVLQVRGDRARRHHECPGDLLVGVPLDQQPQDLQFPVREPAQVTGGGEKDHPQP